MSEREVEASHEDEEDESNTSPSSVSAVNLNFRLPEFYTANPRMWLDSIESLFHMKKVVNQTDKYSAVRSALPYSVVRLLPAIMDGMPAVKPFDTLKAAILEEFTPSIYQRMETLANLPPLGDQKPSELLATIRNLEPEGRRDSDFGRYAWLSRLPEHIRAQLVHQEDVSITVLARTADKIHKSFAGISNIISCDNEYGDEELNAVNNRSTVKRTSQQKQQPRQPQQNYCWYHNEYGSSATKCKDTLSGPCSWRPAQGNGKGRRRN